MRRARRPAQPARARLRRRVADDDLRAQKYEGMANSTPETQW